MIEGDSCREGPVPHSSVFAPVFLRWQQIPSTGSVPQYEHHLLPPRPAPSSLLSWSPNHFSDLPHAAHKMLNLGFGPVAHPRPRHRLL
jgi:hypothetical protein